MATPAVHPWEEALIEDMRAHDGHPTNGPLAGHPLMLLTTIGTRTGDPRNAILTWSRQGDAYVVAGTAGGSPKTPSWVANVLAHPEVMVEIGRRRFRARAELTEGNDRDAAWAEHVRQLPWFAVYPEKTGRVIPVVRLVPIDEPSAAAGA